MAKDRNTMAKRQREAEKRDKAARKREKRELRHTESANKISNMSAVDGQTRVLSIFRRYLMTTGQMLCLSGNELESNKNSLEQLVRDGLLIAETFKGGYSLTESGFDVMRNLSRESA